MSPAAAHAQHPPSRISDNVRHGLPAGVRRVQPAGHVRPGLFRGARRVPRGVRCGRGARRRHRVLLPRHEGRRPRRRLGLRGPRGAVPPVEHPHGALCRQEPRVGLARARRRQGRALVRPDDRQRVARVRRGGQGRRAGQGPRRAHGRRRLARRGALAAHRGADGPRGAGEADCGAASQLRRRSDQELPRPDARLVHQRAPPPHPGPLARLPRARVVLGARHGRLRRPPRVRGREVRPRGFHPGQHRHVQDDRHAAPGPPRRQEDQDRRGPGTRGDGRAGEQRARRAAGRNPERLHGVQRCRARLVRQPHVPRWHPPRPPLPHPRRDVCPRARAGTPQPRQARRRRRRPDPHLRRRLLQIPPGAQIAMHQGRLVRDASQVRGARGVEGGRVDVVRMGRARGLPAAVGSRAQVRLRLLPHAAVPRRRVYRRPGREVHAGVRGVRGEAGEWGGGEVSAGRVRGGPGCGRQLALKSGMVSSMCKEGQSIALVLETLWMCNEEERQSIE